MEHLLSFISFVTFLYILLVVKIPLHVVDNSLCVFVCYPIPCLSVDNLSVTTTMVPSTPTSQPITPHPTTPTLLTPSFAPDPKGNAHTVHHAAFAIHCLSPFAIHCFISWCTCFCNYSFPHCQICCGVFKTCLKATFVLIFHFQILSLFCISYGDLTSELHKGDNAGRMEDIDTSLLSSSLSLILKNECCPFDSV